MSSELPVIPCEELQQRAQFLRQQKPAASQFHQRHSSQSSICHGATGISSSSICGGSGGDPTSPTGTNLVSPTLSSASSSSSGYIDEEDSDDALSHAWPKMDQLFFPDHCCRTSACGVPPRPSSTTGGPSIWGTGWHQVEPLPASFVKTLKASNMLWSGCEKEHYHHHNHHHYGARRQQNQQNRGRRDSGHCGGGGRRSIKRDQGNDSSSWSTVCPGRLPRSLQFID
ncbi:hypothetical protein BGX24_004886 [Mortierella sp. AD032]|nr:hypothetical protein BGX24_004886 [Mortierella sp. AD032]